MFTTETERKGITTLYSLTINRFTNTTTKMFQKYKTVLKNANFPCTKDTKRMPSPTTKIINLNPFLS